MLHTLPENVWYYTIEHVHTQVGNQINDDVWSHFM
jgi:hypothetical protein